MQFSPVGGRISGDLFPSFSIGGEFPTTVYAGDVLFFGGNLHDIGPKKATVFLNALNADAETQPYFSREETQFFDAGVSGTSFYVPMTFLEPGEYTFGVIFDDKGNSPVVPMTVLPRPLLVGEGSLAEKEHMATDVQSVVTSDGTHLELNWELPDPRTLTRVKFGQKEKNVELYLGNSMAKLQMPVEYFWDFDVFEPIEIDVAFAVSEDGTQDTRTTKWSRVFAEPFLLTEAFEKIDENVIETVALDDFIDRGIQVFVRGAVVDEKVRVHEKAFVKAPDGTVREYGLEFDAQRNFAFDLRPLIPGTYVMEMIDDAGLTVWQDGFFVRDGTMKMLPALAYPTTEVRTIDVDGVRNWVNLVREEYGVRPVRVDETLEKRAQQKAVFFEYDAVRPKDFESTVVAQDVYLQVALDEVLVAPHTRNILLQEDWKRIGVGLVEASAGRNFSVVLLFEA